VTGPGWSAGACELAGELDPLVEQPGSGAAADGGAGLVQAGDEGVLEVSCARRAVARRERAAGVGQDCVEGGAGFAFGDGADDLGVVGGVPAGQIARAGAPQPEPGGVEDGLADAFPRPRSTGRWRRRW
jgi:hypothetical protein